MENRSPANTAKRPMTPKMIWTVRNMGNLC